MSAGFITPGAQDPHKEAIDGPKGDPWPTDHRVKGAVRANWLIGDDPAPEYSRLDGLDGLDESLVTPSRPVPAREVLFTGPVIQPNPNRDWAEIRRNTFVIVSSVIILAACIAFGYFIRPVTS